MDTEFCQMPFLHCGDDHIIFNLHFVNVMYHIDLQMYLGFPYGLKLHWLVELDIWVALFSEGSLKSWGTGGGVQTLHSSGKN